jgi:hypothetical protein
MKMATIAILSAAVLASGLSAASASDAPTNRQKAEEFWIATGDPVYGRQAGLTEAQINASRHLPAATVDLTR